MSDCPHCRLPMQRHIGKNGQVFWKCPICQHEEPTPDLDTPSYNSWEVNSEKL